MFKLFKPIDDYKAAYTKLKKEHEKLSNNYHMLREINKKDLQVLQIAMQRNKDYAERYRELQLEYAELQAEFLKTQHEYLRLNNQLIEAQAIRPEQQVKGTD